jgi:hypothetical protein
MAYTKAQWDQVQHWFEIGIPLSEIAKKTEIKDKGSISRKAKQEGWVKGVLKNRPPISAKPKFVNEFDVVCKIGITGNIERRIEEMQIGCPFNLFAVGVYAVERPAIVEMMLHSFFYKKRVRGEWFKLDQADINYIKNALGNVCDVVPAIGSENG